MGCFFMWPNNDANGQGVEVWIWGQVAYRNGHRYTFSVVHLLPLCPPVSQSAANEMTFKKGDIFLIISSDCLESRAVWSSLGSSEVYCASQFMLCDCPGRIRWGIKNPSCMMRKRRNRSPANWRMASKFWLGSLETASNSRDDPFPLGGSSYES